MQSGISDVKLVICDEKYIKINPKMEKIAIFIKEKTINV